MRVKERRKEEITLVNTFQTAPVHLLITRSLHLTALLLSPLPHLLPFKSLFFHLILSLLFSHLFTHFHFYPLPLSSRVPPVPPHCIYFHTSSSFHLLLLLLSISHSTLKSSLPFTQLLIPSSLISSSLLFHSAPPVGKPTSFFLYPAQSP